MDDLTLATVAGLGEAGPGVDRLDAVATGRNGERLGWRVAWWDELENTGRRGDRQRSIRVRALRAADGRHV